MSRTAKWVTPTLIADRPPESGQVEPTRQPCCLLDQASLTKALHPPVSMWEDLFGDG